MIAIEVWVGGRDVAAMRKWMPVALVFGLVAAKSVLHAHPAHPDKAAGKPVLPPKKRHAWFGAKAAARMPCDPRLVRATEFALRRAHPKPTFYCWRYVKDALLASKVISSRPTSPWAKQAGDELCRHHGFVKLDLDDPRDAPVGAVIVYGGNDAGHVEMRTAFGYVSDFFSSVPYKRPVLGIYVKPA